ncbi:hypothetical protein FEF65_04880 [Mariprofundus erugo]|uniref:Putative endonuclease Z1 domain-containing protein n=1 Tax=Mariprofundus erugo TaxID=2528639 RepID=A0A5R9GPY1_9PROT|nr:Z1 domain-containing protein [Mariprofundus erugo]TLS68326.1 hypothetical protein FEF65_04880 [Mariprofundus erugo]
MSKIHVNPIGIAMNIINGRPLTDELLEETLGILLQMEGVFDKEMIDEVRIYLETHIGVTHSIGESLTKGEDHVPWVSDIKGTTSWHYWDSYKQLLESFGRNGDFIRVLDDDTDKILTECGNPMAEGAWRLRGLVMGDVQSGKTANYTGLIAKAADAGYKVIILLTGMIEDLRKQTQARLDEGFVGRNSNDVLSRNMSTTAIGAGKFRKKTASVLTSVDADFLTSNLRALGGVPLENVIAAEPILFVLKKNKSTLENLSQWLGREELKHGQNNLPWPMLLLDDEADNASVNTKKEGQDPATINKLIKDILSKFSRASYVAYTATPFANVFINPEDSSDLFPSDFIYSLNTPSNYIGAGSIFLDDGEHSDQLKVIDDAEEYFPYGHKMHLPVEAIPESLKDAIRVFFLSCAMRDLLKEKLKHRSMLVNVSLFNDVQSKLASKVQGFCWELKEEIKQYLLSASWESHQELRKLRDLWFEEYDGLRFGWDDIRRVLHEAVASIDVIVVNQKATDDQKLNYAHYDNTQKGRRVIAIGGLTLSRGLTLEGLCVSYFYRNSKAYDTLLQMGRWFGYRPGYADLFRIWMDSEAQGWYAHIAGAVNKLRSDFRRMSANRLPPASFGMRVQSHTDALIVTALNKMRNSTQVEYSVSFSSLGTETAYIPNSKVLHDQNMECISKLLALESPPEKSDKKTSYLWRGISNKRVAEFISDLNISNMNIEFLEDSDGAGRPLIDFIRDNDYAQLKKWDVCIPQGTGTNVVQLAIEEVDGVRCRKRQFEQGRKGSGFLAFNKHRVGDASDEMVGMNQTEVGLAKANWEEERNKDPKKGKSIPGYIYRAFRSTPLMTIHLVECSSASETEKEPKRKMMAPERVEAPVMVAISLSFPDFDPEFKGKRVAYRLNKVAVEQIFGRLDDEDQD